MPILRVGTDCSGIEAPIQALIQLKIPFEHVFSSDIDKYCIQSIKANYKPKIIFGDKDGLFPEGDITKRDIKDVPDIDLYVCGFPCQPFSTAGKRKGFKDKRGNVFWSCLEVIELKQPKYFILENVKGLLWNDNKKTWKVIWEDLQKLEKYGYKVQWKVLNTRDNGIPQNRERVFIVGTKGSFEWPKQKKMKSLKKFIDIIDNNSIEIPNYGKILLDIVPKNAVFISFGFRFFKHPYAHLYCPCIASSDAHKIWVKPISRYININELLMLQGFPKKFKRSVSNTQLKRQIGNSMSVNVIHSIFRNIF
jgi:DNA (cytosine-5)-methyltransferase 1